MKEYVMLLAAAGIIGLSGCSDSEKIIEGEVQNVVTAGGEVQSQELETTAKSQEAESQETDPSQDAAGTKGYAFLFQDTAVEVDADAATVIQNLGEPLSYFEAPSCAFQGLDKIYTYNGFEIDTYPMDEKDYISAVILKDDSVMTAEGVGIGDSVEKLEQTYGSDGTKEESMIVYDKDGMKLCFILQKDEIISVEYRSAVLDQ